MRTIQQQLQKWMKANKMFRTDKHKKEPKPKRFKERFTERELKELMGVNRPVYRRAKGGAFRQR
uniref:Phage protein n=1 Tax=Geobacillus sp. (strain Y4.1MC1) TaxID=581103 RepID=A0A7U3YCT6_GEOS0